MSVSVAANNDNATTKVVKKSTTNINSVNTINKKSIVKHPRNTTKLIKENNKQKLNKDNNSFSNKSMNKKVINKTIKAVETDLKVFNVNEDNFSDYMSLSSGTMKPKREIFKDVDKFVLNFSYIPEEVEEFKIGYGSYSKYNLTLMGNGLKLNNTEFIVDTNFKQVRIENFRFNYDDSYTGSYVSIKTSCVLNNVTINVETTRNYSSIPLYISSSCTVENCSIIAKLPSSQIPWEISELENEPFGIGVKIKSSDVRFNNNLIDISESCVLNGTGQYRSIYGLYNLASGLSFYNNTFSLRGTQYTYGIVARSLNTKIINNNITVNSEIYAAGINIEGTGIRNNLMLGNFINVTAGYGVSDMHNNHVAYGCLLIDYSCGGESYGYSDYSMVNNSYINNTIVGDAGQIYAIEMWGGVNATLSGNFMNVSGRTPMGIGAIGINVSMDDNIIYVNGTHNGTEGSADYIDPRTVGIFLFGMEEGGIVTNNVINSIQGRAVLLQGTKNLVIKENSFKTDEYAYVIEGDSLYSIIQDNAIMGKSDDISELINLRNLTENTVSNNAIANVSMIELSATSNEIYLSNTTTITITLKDEQSNTIPNQNIILQVNEGFIQRLKTNENGICTYVFKSDSTGTKNITVTFYGSNKYSYSTNSLNIIVKEDLVINTTPTTNNTTNPTNGSSNPNKNNTSSSNTTNTPTKLSTKITVNPVTATIGKTVTITATIKDQNNKPVNTGSAVFKVNGVKIGESKVTSGTTKITYLVPNSWITTTPKLEVTYTGNNNYKTSTLTQSGLIKVNKGTTKLTLTTDKTSIKAGQKVTFTVKLTDANTKTGLTDTITIKVNGKSIKANVKNGKATVTYTVPRGTDAQTIKATTTYSSKYHNKATATSKFKVTKTTPTIKKTKITYKNKKTTIKATIKDATKKLLNKNVKVTVKVDGKAMLKNKVIKNGKISLSFKKALKKGNHKIIITSASTKAFNKATLKTTFKV